MWLGSVGLGTMFGGCDGTWKWEECHWVGRCDVEITGSGVEEGGLTRAAGRLHPDGILVLRVIVWMFFLKRPKVFQIMVRPWQLAEYKRLSSATCVHVISLWGVSTGWEL